MSEEKKDDLLEIKGPDFQACFSRIANELYNNYCLNVNGNKYRMLELEFYYLSKEHPDVFCHNDPLQKEKNLWYFHRTGTTYIENSFKGLDITLGNGGILIRTISGKDGKVIEGPSKVLDLILKTTGHEKVKSLVTELEATGLSAFGGSEKKSKLFIEPCNDYLSYEIYGTPRVGISLKRDFKARLPFIMAPYRFSGFYHGIKKNRVLVVLSLHYLHGVKDLSDLQKLSGAKKAQITKYLELVKKQEKVADDKLNKKCGTLGEMVELFCWKYWDKVKS